MVGVLLAEKAQRGLVVKDKFVYCLKMAIAISIGTAIYQLIIHSESAFDFYKPAFVGAFSFVVLSIYYSVKPPKNG
jgi:hypothetical protein